ncbi:MAG: hypothetical protein WC223_12760 [Bacteroidales bacterium]|jgi:hypothetical protein
MDRSEILFLLLKNFFCGIIALVFFMGTGKLFFSIFKTELYNKQKKYLNLFLELVAGITIIVASYAMIRTTFRTINILFLLLFIFFIYKKLSGKHKLFNSKLVFDFRDFVKNILTVIILFFPVYLYQEYLFLGHNLSILHTPYPESDHFFYSNISYCISKTGIENCNIEFNLLFPSVLNKIAPYHFFELWLNGILFNVFGVYSYLSLIFITYPILILIIFIGIISLIEHIGKVNFYSIIFCFVLLLIDGVYFNFYEKSEILRNNTFYTNISAFSLLGYKYCPIFLFGILSLNLLIRKNITFGLFLLTACAIISIGVFPGVIGGLILICIWLIYKKINVNEIKSVLIFLFIFFISYILIYKLFGDSNTQSYVRKNSYVYAFINNKIHFIDIKRIIATIIIPIIQLIVICFPFFIIPFIYFKRLNVFCKNNLYNYNILIFVLSFLASGLIAAALNDKIINSKEFFNNLLPLLLIIFYFSLLIIFVSFNNNKKFRIYFLIIVFLYAFVTQYNVFKRYKQFCAIDKNDNFISVRNEISKFSPETNVASFIDENKFKKCHLYLDIVLAPTYMLLFGFERLININDPYSYMKEGKSVDDYYFNTKPFGHYIEELKKNKLFVSIEESRIRFINEFNIKLILMDYSCKISEDKLNIEKKIIDEQNKKIILILK